MAGVAASTRPRLTLKRRSEKRPCNRARESSKAAAMSGRRLYPALPGTFPPRSDNSAGIHDNPAQRASK
jgi:hypothetical protein